jgi:hypothetical protein
MKRLTLTLAALLLTASVSAQSAIRTPRVTVEGRTLSAISAADQAVIWYDSASHTLRLSRNAGSFYVIPTAERLYGSPIASPTCSAGDYWLFVDTSTSTWRRCENGTVSDFGSGGSGAVDSVFGRTGAVVAASGDYTAAQVTNAAATNAANTFTAAQTIRNTTASANLLDLVGSANPMLRITDYSNANANPTFRTRVARGTEGAPAAIVSGDWIGIVDWWGHDGSAFVRSARMDVISQGTIATGSVPSYLRFVVRGSGGEAERLRIDPTNTAASPLLQINNTGAGLFSPAANTLAFSTGGVERLRLTSGGAAQMFAVSPPTCSAGQYFLYVSSSSSTWRKCENGTASDIGSGAGSFSLTDLTDVTITSPATGQTLEYNGTAWVNAAPTGGGTTGSYVTAGAPGTAQSYTNSTVAVVEFGTATDDDDGWQTNSTTFTVPAGKAGKYLIKCGMGWQSNANGSRFLNILKNGGITPTSIVRMSPGCLQCYNASSTVVFLDESDTVQCNAQQTSGTTLTMDLPSILITPML